MIAKCLLSVPLGKPSERDFTLFLVYSTAFKVHENRSWFHCCPVSPGGQKNPEENPEAGRSCEPSVSGFSLPRLTHLPHIFPDNSQGSFPPYIWQLRFLDRYPGGVPQKCNIWHSKFSCMKPDQSSPQPHNWQLELARQSEGMVRTGYDWLHSLG